jgi:hypothetical protein
MTANIETLEAIRDQLPAGDLSFADSLLRQARERGLSRKQLFWVDKLIERAKNPPKTVEIGDLSKLIAFFENAGQKLKRPSIALTVGDIVIRLTIAGERSKVPGSILVAEDAPYGQGKWFGRILRDGTFAPGRDEAPEGLFDLLRRLADKPAETAAEQGKLSGHCCFCDLPLKDERSLAVGYGKTCAHKWGLPWGAKA